MKRSSRFLAVLLMLTVIFSAVIAAATYYQLGIIKENSDEKIIEIIAAVRKKYPDMSEVEIAEILNSNSDTEKSVQMLEKFGITSSDWAAYGNTAASEKMIAVNTALCAGFCLVMCGVFAIYVRRRRAEERQIAEYISRINNKEYDLSIGHNSEDDMSLLKNELYKITVNLREQADNSLNAKKSLKNSLSDISHQLKTPITSILIMVDNIIDDDNMPVDLRREFLQDIRRETNNISFLVQSLLTLSRFDADAVEFKIKRENASEIIGECAGRLSVLAEVKGVTLKTQCDNSISLLCDSKWICEAITNIVKNCIEHTAEGGTVEIAVEKNKIYTQISVTDNGCGIAEKDLPHIFERFYKGKNSCEGSVGIGLALAKTIIEKSGGQIRAESQENSGSRFEIKLFEREAA